MDYKTFGLETLAILVSYIVLVIPLSSATTVHIFYGGNEVITMECEDYDGDGVPDNDDCYRPGDRSDLVYKQVVPKSGSMRTGSRIQIIINNKKTTPTIKKVYLYRCKELNPIECARLEPIIADQKFDVEFNWIDMIERGFTISYPQVANIMTLVQLEDSEGRETWTGFWDTIKRDVDESNVPYFDIQSENIDDVYVYAKSEQYVTAIGLYLKNYEMIPFSWVNRIVFGDINAYFGIAGNEDELEARTGFQEITSTDNSITSIIKDFYFIFPNTTSGINSPFTLNMNPSFICGDGRAETLLGETWQTCCFDAGCPDDTYYCDVEDADSPGTGTCRRIRDITLTVNQPTIPVITDCTDQGRFNISAQVINYPSSLPSKLAGSVTLNGVLSAVSCDGGPPNYRCSVAVPPGVGCGTHAGYVIGQPNMINLTLPFSDGPGSMPLKLGTYFGDLTVNYDCDCPEGRFCELSGTNYACVSRSMANLNIKNMTTFLDDYQHGTTTVDLVLRIDNAPSTFAPNPTETFEYKLGDVESSVACSHDSEGYFYCHIPSPVTSYDSAMEYMFEDNSVNYTMSYTDYHGPITVQEELTKELSDVIIPSISCGDDVCSGLEQQAGTYCCLDCGYAGGETGTHYCDGQYGAVALNTITGEYVSVDPTQLVGHNEEHEVYFEFMVNNFPSDAEIDAFYRLNNEIKASTGGSGEWSLECDDGETVRLQNGRVYCKLTIPPLDYTDPRYDNFFNGDAENPELTLTPQEMGFRLVFSDAFKDSVDEERELDIDVAIAGDLVISVHAPCGDGDCEAVIGEDSTTCCLDCPCGPGQFCSHDPDEEGDTGTCSADVGTEGGPSLVIDGTAGSPFDTCEKDNYVEVQLHVELTLEGGTTTQPGGMELQVAYAQIDNIFTTETDDFRQTPANCDTPEELNAVPGGRTTFLCEIKIPKDPGCSKDTYPVTYASDRNTLFFVISYYNGTSLVSRELSTSYGTVTVDQGTESMKDITDDLTANLKEHLDKIREYAKNIQDFMNDFCLNMKWLIAFIAVALVLSIGGFIWGGIEGGEGGAKIAEGGGKLGQAVMDTFMKICEMVIKWNKVAINMEVAYMALDQMDFCIRVYQHNMDMGSCEGNEEECLNYIQGCINDGVKGMNDGLKAATDLMEEIQDSTEELFNDITEGGMTLIEGLSMNPTGSLPEPEGCYNGYCCGYVPDGKGGYKQAKIKVKPTGVDNCNDMRIELIEGDVLSSVTEEPEEEPTETVCTPGILSCLGSGPGSKLQICNQDGTAWTDLETCDYGCLNLKCIDEPLSVSGLSFKAGDVIDNQKDYDMLMKNFFKGAKSGVTNTYTIQLVCYDGHNTKIATMNLQYCEGTQSEGCTSATCSNAWPSEYEGSDYPKADISQIYVRQPLGTGDEKPIESTEVNLGNVEFWLADAPSNVNKLKWEFGDGKSVTCKIGQSSGDCRGGTTKSPGVFHTYANLNKDFWPSGGEYEVNLDAMLILEGDEYDWEVPFTVTIADRIPEIKKVTLTITETGETIVFDFEKGETSKTIRTTRGSVTIGSAHIELKDTDVNYGDKLVVALERGGLSIKEDKNVVDSDSEGVIRVSLNYLSELPLARLPVSSSPYIMSVTARDRYGGEDEKEFNIVVESR